MATLAVAHCRLVTTRVAAVLEMLILVRRGRPAVRAERIALHAAPAARHDGNSTPLQRECGDQNPQQVTDEYAHENVNGTVVFRTMASCHSLHLPTGGRSSEFDSASHFTPRPCKHR